MSLKNDYSQWLKHGRQRAAVAQVLRKPMTATEICAAAHIISPRMRLRDVWFQMRQFEERGLAVCLNRRQMTGRLYCLTDKGRKEVDEAFGIAVGSPPTNINWRKYSFVVRAKTRRMTLSSLDHLEMKTTEPQTATEIRKQIRADYPVGLNPVIRAVRELAAKQLITCVGHTQLRACKLYRLTQAGRAIAKQLRW